MVQASLFPRKRLRNNVPAMPTFDLPPYESLEDDELIARIQQVRRRWAHGC